MSDPIVSVTPDALTLNPGESAQVTVSVDPASTYGSGLVSIPVEVPAPRVVPPTIPHPKLTAAKHNGFYFVIKKLDPSLGDFTYWSAAYLYATPYTPNTGWVPGDRVAYGCGYAFLQQNGEIIGRAGFQRLSAAASYALIVDKFMDEGERFYDGSRTPDPNKQYSDCPPVQQSYATVIVPDERPKIVYWSADDKALEIRDYAGTVVTLPNVTFDLVEVIDTPFQIVAPITGPQTVNSRVTVLAREAGVPFAVVYYDGIGTGQVSEERIT